MRPTPESLTADYMRDLESDIAVQAREIAAGRTDIIDYQAECIKKLAALRAAGDAVRVDRYGIPHPTGRPVIRSTAEIPRGSAALEKKLNAAAAAGVQDAINR